MNDAAPTAPPAMDLAAAIAEFRALLGPAHVVDAGESLLRHGQNAGGLQRRVDCVLIPPATDTVPALIVAARRHRVPLYPFSTGRNWGMGSKLPVRDGGALVDLSQCNRIRHVDPRGWAVIEPGVTQGQLHEHLRSNGMPLFLDPTGSATFTSLVGNILERGVGYFAPRFQSLMGLEIALGNGQTVRTGFWHDDRIADPHGLPYGIGPHLDGLFTQSSFGIVTAAVVALQPLPERFSAFWARLQREDQLPHVIDALGELRRKGVVRSVVHVADQYRSGSALMPLLGKPSPKVGGGPIDAALGTSAAVLPWSAIGPLWGNARMVKAAEAEVKRRLRGICEVQIMTERKVALGIGVLSALAFIPALKRLRDTARAVRPLLGMARGVPTDAALPSVLWPVEDVPPGPLDPDQSHSGVIYVLPAIPLDGTSAQKAVAIARGTAGELGLQCYITLNTMTDHALEGVINVAFDRRDADQVRRAQTAAERMLQRFYEAGMPPYRAGIQQMGAVVRMDDAYWQTVHTLKQALDPDGIIAPGRYCP